MHCRWVQIFDKDLKRMQERHKSKRKLVETKICQVKKVRKYFVNPKIENEVFG